MQKTRFFQSLNEYSLVTETITWQGVPMPEDQISSETLAVVKNHLDAVLLGDPLAMASDYSDSAVLVRGSESYTGITEIAEYFKTVPLRMGSAEIEFFEPEVSGEIASFKWRIQSGDTITRGKDTVVVRNGKIVEQQVMLLTEDF